MKKLQLLIIALLLSFFSIQLKAQLPDGSTAADFTFKDMNGNTQNLYSYLSKGKAVVIDVSATWCGPCWMYHESGELENFYKTYGPNGTNQIMVLYIEGDGATTDADMKGQTTGSQGDWLTGTPYPMCNPTKAEISVFNKAYNIQYFPSIYMICPDKKTTLLGQLTIDKIYKKMMLQCPIPTAMNDAGIVESPSGIFCNSSVPVTISVRNFGASPLTSCTVNYQVDGGSIKAYAWTGNLTTGQIAKITLPALTIAAGVHTFTSFTSNPNNTADGVPANDKTIVSLNVASISSKLPVIEGMESSFPPNGWALGNDDDDITFEKSVPGGFGKSGNSTKIKFSEYYNNIGAIDYLTMPPVDFSAAAGYQFTFNVAYAPFGPQYVDNLAVEVSDDCGKTWMEVYKKGGDDLATAPAIGPVEFVPTDSDWRNESINMNTYAGKSGVMIRFKAINGGGNNLYIDDINILNSTVGIKDLDFVSSISAYPNPTNGDLTVNMGTPGVLTAQILNVLGEVVSESSINNTSIVSMHFDLTTQPDGVYFLEIQSKNAKTVKKIIVSH